MTQAAPQIIDGFEWGITYGEPGEGQAWPSKQVTTDVGGPVGFGLAAQAAAALDGSKPVRAIEFKGRKKLAIATLVKPSANPAPAAALTDVPQPHARALSL